MKVWVVKTAASVAVFMVIVIPTVARAQDSQDIQQTLTRVRSLYESADYEQALQVLSTLKPSPANTEAAAYRVFCLVALGRAGEARSAVESIVRTDPMFHPQAGQVSPRIRQFFDDARKPLLADVARQQYASAKAAYDRRDWAAARDGFARVTGVLDDLNSSDASLADLKTVAAGFRDLAAVAIQTDVAKAAAAAASAKPTPTPTPETKPDAMSVSALAPAAPPTPAVYDDSSTDVSKPVVLTRSMPAWRPTTVELKMSFTGTLELLVSEDGKVMSASLSKSVHPRYDASLLEAARSWTFQPAMRGGTPVRYRYVMTINLTGPIK